MKILLVDDEPTLRESLSQFLKSEGLQVLEAVGVTEAKHVDLQGVQLILLDWMLIDGSGIDLLRWWRTQGVQIPVIFLTAKVDVVDKILGLESGSNDYVTKPFDPRELLARIRVHLRNTMASQLCLNGIVMDLENRKVTFGDSEKSLTKTEFDLLKFFLSHPEKVFSRDEILQSVWGYDQFPTTRTVDVHVMQLRQSFRSEFFETIHGIGYRMKRLK
jgi:DNA-binding response OmpR family regulator